MAPSSSWASAGVTTDTVGGTTLTSDILDNGEADTLQAWVKEVAEAVQADVLVSDDADGCKAAADANGLQHLVCKKHVLNNTEASHDAGAPELVRDADGLLAEIGVTPEQAVTDNDELLRRCTSANPRPQPMPSWQRFVRVTLRRAHRRSWGSTKRPWRTACACSAWIAGTSGNA